MMGTLAHERLSAFYLNGQRQLISARLVSSGGRSTVRSTFLGIFKTAMAEGASAIVLAHNHPSGNVMPSWQDRVATARLRSLGASLRIAILDHLIVSQSRIYSMAAEEIV